jgi:hypothetical protein
MRNKRFASSWAPAVMILALAMGLPQMKGQETSDSDSDNECEQGQCTPGNGRRLFTKETFGGNGRTCLTCHSLETGTVSLQDARERFRKNPSDPLFVFDGSDNGKGLGVSRMLNDATILVEIPLPPNVSLGDDQHARSVVLRRGIPSTHNTPALDPILMFDGREPNLPTQAGNAIRRHAQVTGPLSESDLLQIAQFERTAQFFSSPSLRRYAGGGLAPTLPEGRTESERRGKLFFIDAPITGDFKRGACGVCHSGPMLNQTNQFFPVSGLRFQSVNVSEFNAAGNPIRPFVFRNGDGSQTTVLSPDPGRALITGVPFANGGPPFLFDLNAFKIPTLWGVKDTAPYFHDNSAKTLEDVAAHYARFLPLTPAPAQLTQQDQQDMVAYLKLLH